MLETYYNEIEPFACAWLRELIAKGVITKGDVDERDIRQADASLLGGYTRAHFFAGIGVWDYALRQAGWPEALGVWTGSCPCQPFSVSGKRAGASDGRHLWPAWFPLIRECRPEFIFGEQVASDDGLAWLDLVCSDLENEGYAVGAVDTCAAGFGAPHIRQRLYFVAVADGGHTRAERLQRSGQHGQQPQDDRADRLAESGDTERRTFGQHGENGRDGQNGGRSQAHGQLGTRRAVCDVADSNGRGQSVGGLAQAFGHGEQCVTSGELGDAAEGRRRRESRALGLERSSWADCDWFPCVDGKARPVEPGTFPLAHGAARRVGRLRGYGNAIVAPQAAAFVQAVMQEFGL